ncbi:MAG: right-handed parallel beta-helix repeat-containing protein [Calditrichaeota bacterium]|nr:right-handed parallel beta-helix repeat-containing protein [Calditrichota bacterium]
MKIHNKYLSTFLVIAIGLYFNISPSSAAILHVPDDFETIPEAVENAEDNDTIMVAAGVHYGTIGQIREPDNLHIIGNPDLESIWDGEDEGSALYATGISVHIENFIFRNSYGLAFGRNSSAVIKNCVFNDSMDTAIDIGVNTGSFLIEKCLFFDGMHEGIIVDTPQEVIIRNCIFLSGIGIELYSNASGFIENNLFINCRWMGLYIGWGGDNELPVVRNNIFIGCREAVHLSGNEEQRPVETAAQYFMRFQYNLMWDNEADICVILSWRVNDMEFDGVSGESRPYPGTGVVYRDPLFVDEEEEDFHLRVASPCIDAGDPDSPRDPDRTRADIGPFFFDQREYESINIPLDRGWNLISSHINPVARDIRVLFDDLLERESLYIVKDDSGRFYMPEFDYNNIPDWNFRKGYAVKVNEADTLTLTGEPVAPDTPIRLARGWNTVAYFPEEEVDVLDALANIEDVLVFVKDGRGRFCWPLYQYNGIPPLRRNFGYWMNVSRNTELIWNVPEDDR